MWKTTTVILVVSIGIVFFLRSNSVSDVPNLPETFWGPAKNKEASKEIRPFVIDVPRSVIEDLNERLAKKRELVQPLEDTAWTYGISTTYLNDVLDYWRTKYNWTERQALLNKYPQYITNIQVTGNIEIIVGLNTQPRSNHVNSVIKFFDRNNGLDIHFLHVKPYIPPDRKNIKVLPLLLVHGWPGSVVEFQKIIPILTTPRPNKDFVFEVIAPSLPGYAFSQAAVRPGLAPAQIAVIFKNLMQRLGFNKFYAQGGDWGSLIVSNLGALFSDNVIGVHTNMCMPFQKSSTFWRILGAFIPSLVVDNEHYSKMYPLGYHFGRLLEETGYFHIQATKPDTIGAAVAASPVGVAGYILEKFSTWTNPDYRFRPDGGLTEKFTLDELLDNVMLYWVTNSLTTSVRIYAECYSTANNQNEINDLPIDVPAACAAFPFEIMYSPESLLRDKYTNLLQFNHLPRGGHFAAFEEPALLADDFVEFVSKNEDMRKKTGNKDVPKKIKEPTNI